jgi:nucleoside diphosphate kinase
VAIERTLAMIKPDAVGRGLAGDILSRIHAADFQIVAIKSTRMTMEQAGGFYAVHRERGFFKELCEFMSSGKVVALVLEGENADHPVALHHGRDRSRESRGGHHTQRPGRQHPIQLHPRFGRAGDRGVRNRLFLRRRRTHLASIGGTRRSVGTINRHVAG